MSKFTVEVDTDLNTARVVGHPIPTPVAPMPAWRNDIGYPKATNIYGVSFNLMAPINPMWRPSTAAFLLGQQGATVEDPAVPPGARSEAGYPTVKGQIPMDDAMLANDEAVGIYLKRTANRDQAGTEWQAAENARNAVLQPGQVDVSTLTPDDVKFWWTFNSELAGVAPLGPRNSEKTLVDWIANGSGEPPGMPNLAGMDRSTFYSGNWDWANYRGPFRAVLAKHRGVPDV